MRLIDGHALMESLQKAASNTIKPDFAKDLLEAQRLTINAPTIDAVEVVRCKDCRHRVHDKERNLYYCEMYYGQGDVSDENFCQWGERRK